MKDNVTRREFLKTGSFVATVGATSQLPKIQMVANDVQKSDSHTPALLGGPRAHQGDWPFWPHWDSANDPIIADVMKRGIWSRSNLVAEFEEQWASVTGTDYALAVVNGTNALSASLMELDIGPGDEVIISPYTFSATIFGVLYQKAIPVFADIDPTTFQIDPAKIKEKITPRTKAILPVHICGFPSDMQALFIPIVLERKFEWQNIKLPLAYASYAN